MKQNRCHCIVQNTAVQGKDGTLSRSYFIPVNLTLISKDPCFLIHQRKGRFNFAYDKYRAGLSVHISN